MCIHATDYVTGAANVDLRAGLGTHPRCLDSAASTPARNNEAKRRPAPGQDASACGEDARFHARVFPPATQAPNDARTEPGTTATATATAAIDLGAGWLGGASNRHHGRRGGGAVLACDAVA